MQQWHKWKDKVLQQLGPVYEPQLPLHCTLLYDATQQCADYRECWRDEMTNRTANVICHHIYVGPQGLAVGTTLPPEIHQWFQVPNSTPHVTLLVTKGHNSCDLGPMVKNAVQVSVWRPTEDKCIHVSSDGQYL